MLPPSPSPALRGLTPTQLETFYWQARQHDGCFTMITLFQHFVNLFPPFTHLRIRTLDDTKPVEHTTSTTTGWQILEMNLVNPRSMNMTLVDSSLYITGCDPVSLHAVLAFNLGSSEGTILDLASLQFGDVGRGFVGKGLFALEPVKQYEKRLEEFAQRNTFDNLKLSHRINSHTTPNNEWLKKIAKRAKARWDNRDKVHWCGHCGAPPLGGDLISCPSCNKAWYCNEDHKSAAWPFHKHFCE